MGWRPLPCLDRSCRVQNSGTSGSSSPFRKTAVVCLPFYKSGFRIPWIKLYRILAHTRPRGSGLTGEWVKRMASCHNRGLIVGWKLSSETKQKHKYPGYPCTDMAESYITEITMQVTTTFDRWKKNFEQKSEKSKICWPLKRTSN